MKVLLDECVTKKLKGLLQDFDVYTVSEMGWRGAKNGRLLKLCVENNFDVLLTVDKNLMHQQKLNDCLVTIAVLDSLTNRFEDLKLFIPSFCAQTNQFEKGRVYLIENNQLSIK